MIELDFEIDCLTHSIRNVATGDSLQTNVLPLTKADLKTVSKKNKWRFNWRTEFDAADREVYKLVICDNPDVIQGLVCFTVSSDHIFMDLVESAPFNIGINKMYDGVCGNLTAYVCKRAFEQGFEGAVSFLSKTNLIAHYIRTLGAIHIGGGRMIMPSMASKNLVDNYF
ncbi:hypothetical protein AGMMS49982_15640 [Bacteroidia bacterium]|nr:hypothetical protein AGMMS49982_15640 [Bacteroidia bacterium]